MVKEAVIVAGVRTAVGKAPRGTLRATRPDDMAAAAIAEVVRRAEGLDPVGAFALVDRDEGGREAVEASGVKVHALFTRRDFPA